jgi:tetratricopeptide (TPR) repeat protein
VSALVLLNVRAEGLASDPALAEWLVGLGRDLPLARITLGSLRAEDTEELVQGLGIALHKGTSLTPAGPARGGQPSQVADFARWLYGETRGHPLFLTETLKALTELGALAPRQRDDGRWTFEIQPGLLDAATRQSFLPPGLREVLRARLARLNPPASMLVVAAAVLGRECSFELLSRVAELSEREALSALDEALRGSLLREAGGAYFFAHDKIRDVVYAEAGEARRRVFHRRALEALRLDGVSAAELAHHALAAGLDDQTFDLNVAAGEEAMGLLAARAAIEHYMLARTIAERRGWIEHIVDLHIRCGKAFVSLTLWPDARRELEFALEGLSQDHEERRAEVLVELALTCWWLLDLGAMERYGSEALGLAERYRRGDLATTTMAVLASGDSATGNLSSAIERDKRARLQALELGLPAPTHMLPLASSVLYWLGRLEEAAASSREAIQVARDVHDSSMMMYALPHLGLALAGRGDYGEAIEVFAEGRRYGREYGVGTLLARSIGMSAGFHRELFDYAGAQVLAEEARDLALALDFPPPAISSGIELMLNFASRGEIGKAEALLPEVVASVEKAAGWHGWLWALRLAEARAEIALGRHDWDGAFQWATVTIEQCRLRGRIKYEAIGLTTRAGALAALGRTTPALADLQGALALARQMGDPALFLRCASALLPVGGTEVLAVEARATVQRIVAALPDDTLRRSFEAAEAVRALYV